MQAKPRLLVLTDINQCTSQDSEMEDLGDPDDWQSLGRLLVYSNEFNIVGLIATAATHRPAPYDATHPPPTGEQLIKDRINAYAQVEANLRLHDPDYPTAAYLLTIVKAGNPERGIYNNNSPAKDQKCDHIGDGKESEASKYIIEMAIASSETDPLYISIWGGATDLAQALWDVKKGHVFNEPDKYTISYDEFVKRLRIKDIHDQDLLRFHPTKSTYGAHPNLNYTLFLSKGKTSGIRGMYLGGSTQLTTTAWIINNVSKDHGPLGALYPDSGLSTTPSKIRAFKESDTPAWFCLLPNGLDDKDRPDFGGWGGRLVKNDQNIYRDAADELIGDEATAGATYNYKINGKAKTVWRWRQAFQNDFAARMDWCVKTVAEANHNPIAVVNGDKTKDFLLLTATPGSIVNLSASGSSDPDGDTLSYKWYQYKEAGTCTGDIAINGSTAQNASFTVPATGGTIHIILEVIDNGTPELTAYRRVIVTVEAPQTGDPVVYEAEAMTRTNLHQNG